MKIALEETIMDNTFSFASQTYFDYLIERKIKNNANLKIDDNKYKSICKWYDDFKNYNDINFKDNIFSKNILQYKDFLKYLEKCWLYHIDNNSNIHVNDDNTGLYITYNPYSINISFEDSSILGILELSTMNQNSLETYINTGKTDKTSDNFLTFVNINVRNIDSSINNCTFSFIIGEEPKFNSEEDNILFKNIINMINESIKNNFLYLLDNNMILIKWYHITNSCCDSDSTSINNYIRFEDLFCYKNNKSKNIFRKVFGN